MIDCGAAALASFSRYLAETELHIERGPARRKLAPGAQVGAEEAHSPIPLYPNTPPPLYYTPI